MSRVRLLAQGLVQGVGFRPFVYRLATERKLTGWVQNTSRGVVIEAQGEATPLLDFQRALREELPPLAHLDEVTTEILPLVEAESDFRIIESRFEAAQLAFIPPDIATCADCACEVLDPADRRYGYPFTNCTNCGPRFTIIEEVPYDRPLTTMAGFVMCPECQREYEEPADRRFHAQPNACPVCGPHLTFDDQALPDEEALRLAADALHRGEVVAIKGLGGYHLACDAENAEAVAKLRQRKRRDFKPFAVMARDLEVIRRHARLSESEEALLTSVERPVVLLEWLPESTLARSVAPGQRQVGLMLPYTPLHKLLFEQSPETLVMTSGNLSEEPIVSDNEEARARLGQFADHFLHHNRPIEVPCDDSVVRVTARGTQLIRRSRGYVPRGIKLARAVRPALGVGAEWKNTFCLTYAGQAVMSQHIGDLTDLKTYEYFGRAVAHLERLLRVKPEIVGYDMHPDYLSTRYAEELEGIERVAFQHHHAHIASVVAEHGLEGPVLGLAADGTGYGPDGTFWGSELLVCEGTDYQRVGSLVPTPLPGGDAAVKEPARLAFAALLALFGQGAYAKAEALKLGLGEAQLAAIDKQLELGVNAPLSSSLGRVFDTVSALLGVCRQAEYEGQPAMELEAATGGAVGAPLPFDLAEREGLWLLDFRPTLARLVEGRLAGKPVGELAADFHTTVVEALTQQVLRASKALGLAQVALSGGSFQNVALVEKVPARLEAAELYVFTNQQVPASDGGLSLGQAYLAGLS